MLNLRQKLLILYAGTPDLNSPIGAWTIYDATGKEKHTTGDSDTPPYPSVFAAMKDGWRVIQLPQQFPAYPGMELTTSYLRFEYVLDKLEEMEAMDKRNLLTSVQMARFAADGLLRFEELVPKEINDEVMRELDEELISGSRAHQGKSVVTLWPESQGLGAMIRLPQVQGIIHSLVGPNAIYDHHAFHKVAPDHPEGQIWHADNFIDPRMHFDIQLFYFPHDTPREMGGTMFLPGSQFRRIHESDIGRYQNFIGQAPTVCKAGTLLVGHHGLWHCAQPNHTRRMRYMFKLRINPAVRQLRLWDTDDLDDPQVGGILSHNHGWYGNEDRLEYVNRIRFWRFLTGNERYDFHYWLTRVENKPETLVSA